MPLILADTSSSASGAVGALFFLIVVVAVLVVVVSLYVRATRKADRLQTELFLWRQYGEWLQADNYRRGGTPPPAPAKVEKLAPPRGWWWDGNQWRSVDEARS